jgi:hypothetical protein
VIHSPSLYQRIPGLVLRFHGCDEEVGESILKTPGAHIDPSDNAWDWLGAGIYFGENDPVRAYEFAEMKRKHPGISTTPITRSFVIGAVIDLGLCSNLLGRTASTDRMTLTRFAHRHSTTGDARISTLPHRPYISEELISGH